MKKQNIFINPLLMASIISGILITSCKSPVAPLQSEEGTLYNYSRSFNFRQRGISQGTANTKVTKSRDGAVTISGIPFFKQGNDNTCGQAVMAAILNFWDIDTSYQTVINETNLGNLPTDPGVIEQYLQLKGLKAKAYKKSSVDYLKSLVDAGKPPIALLDFGGLGNEHYVVVVGYNNTKDTILINDSVNGPFLALKTKDFEAKWKNQSLANLLIFGDKFDRLIFDIGKPE